MSISVSHWCRLIGVSVEHAPAAVREDFVSSMRYLYTTCTLPTLKRVFEGVSMGIGKNGQCHRVWLEKLLKI
jgi:hypothetical protein